MLIYPLMMHNRHKIINSLTFQIYTNARAPVIVEALKNRSFVALPIHGGVYHIKVARSSIASWTPRFTKADSEDYWLPKAASEKGCLPMRDPELLSNCLVENDAKDAGPAKCLRRESFVLSILIQGALVAALLIIPIFTPGVISPRHSFVPLPPYHGGSHLANTVHASQQSAHGARPVLNPVALYQPIKIPEHTANSTDANAGAANNGAPTIGNGDGSGNGPGVDFGMGNSVLTPTVAPPKSPESTKPVRVSAGVEEARLITRIEPVYPPGAIALHMSGAVRLRAIISADGTVSRLDVVTGNPILARAAVAAVGQWRYHPTLLNGRAVEVETDITVIFELTH